MRADDVTGSSAAFDADDVSPDDIDPDDIDPDDIDPDDIDPDDIDPDHIEPDHIDPDDVTIATYEATAATYAEKTRAPSAAVIAFYDDLAEVVGDGQVLELGSGAGRAAGYLEQRGVRVERTDATQAFVDLQRAEGHAVRRLDVRTDDLGGPHDAILADAVLLHLDREQFADVLARARTATRPGGVLAITLKEGDGAGWTTAKLDRPRHYTYWRETPLRAVLQRTGWTVRSLDHVQGATEPWLYVLATADDRAPTRVP